MAHAVTDIKKHNKFLTYKLTKSDFYCHSYKYDRKQSYGRIKIQKITIVPPYARHTLSAWMLENTNVELHAYMHIVL